MLPSLTLPSSQQCYLNVTLSSNVPSTNVYRQLRYTYEAIVTQRDQLLPSYRCYESNSGNRQSFQFSSQPVCSSKHSPASVKGHCVSRRQWRAVFELFRENSIIINLLDWLDSGFCLSKLSAINIILKNRWTLFLERFFKRWPCVTLSTDGVLCSGSSGTFKPRPRTLWVNRYNY